MREESGVLESGCLIVGEKAMEELAGGACLGTEAWMAPLRNVGLASRQVKEWKGDWYQEGLPRQDPG